MRVVHLAAGAAGMYCGSCLHDNRLAAALRAQGRDVVLVPLYTPIRTDEPDVSTRQIYFGGVNVYLQHGSALFRRTPRWLDRVWDMRAVLNLIGRLAGSTPPEKLAALTKSVLLGPAGPLRKELARLTAGLRALRPDVVQLPNLMFAGLARALRAELGAAVVCELTGEDIFLDALPEAQRGEVLDLIRRGAADADAFIALTGYYARHATTHFGLPAERVHTIPLGIRGADFVAPASTARPRPVAAGLDRTVPSAGPPPRPFTIGFLARVCPAKGLDRLARALVTLRATGRDCRVRAAGYLGRADRPYLEQIRAALRLAGLGAPAFEYVGEVSRADKMQFLAGLHALSVPTTYVESKGLYVLEAFAAGVPVVQPDHGSFAELVTVSGGGLLYDAADEAGLAAALARLMDDEPLRQALAAAGQRAVLEHFNVERMAAAAWAVYERVHASRSAAPGATRG